MKHIIKQQEPQELTVWKAMANENWQPAYGDLTGDLKKTVQHALMQEQGYICCYCERRLEENDSHIEHLRPQSDPACDDLDYANILCSCMRNTKKGEPRHCGNLKGDWYVEQLIVSPLDASCESRFAYTGDGRIEPADQDDKRAEKTIAQLGLAIPKLNALRQKAIEPFLDGDLSEEELERFINDYLQKDSDGKFGEFWTTIRYLFHG